MVFNDDVTPSETNVQCFSNPGEESAKGEDATENGCSQGLLIELVSTLNQ